MFSTSVFSVDVARIGPHCNPVPCVLTGRNKSLTLVSRNEVVEGDILLIRPGIEHGVICSGGINVMYLDGLPWSGSSGLAAGHNVAATDRILESCGLLERYYARFGPQPRR